MKNKEWVDKLKKDGIYDVITRIDISPRQMAEILARGRDLDKIEYKIKTIIDVLQDRINNPEGLIL